MPKSEPERFVPPGRDLLAQDEELAATVSSYVDGELFGEDLRHFEALVESDEALFQEVAGMRRIARQLSNLGANILDEPIPEALLKPLAKLGSGL